MRCQSGIFQKKEKMITYKQLTSEVTSNNFSNQYRPVQTNQGQMIIMTYLFVEKTKERSHL